MRIRLINQALVFIVSITLSCKKHDEKQPSMDMQSQVEKAILNGDSEYFKRISKNNEVEIPTMIQGAPTLVYAIVNCEPKSVLNIVKALIELGADVKGRPGNLSLIKSIERGYKDIVVALIKNGADVNVRDGIGLTVLDYAVIQGEIEISKILLNQGVDCNNKDMDGKTTLMRAAMSKNKSAAIVELLINAGARLNDQDKDGNTSCILSAMFGNSEITSTLIKSGCDVNLKNKSGRSLKDYMKVK